MTDKKEIIKYIAVALNELKGYANITMDSVESFESNISVFPDDKLKLLYDLCKVLYENRMPEEPYYIILVKSLY